MTDHRRTISIKPSGGLLNPKKKNDHKRFNDNWKKYTKKEGFVFWEYPSCHTK
jgi:hypothetical protein